jgi:hypothetical protein
MREHHTVEGADEGDNEQQHHVDTAVARRSQPDPGQRPGNDDRVGKEKCGTRDRGEPLRGLKKALHDARQEITVQPPEVTKLDGGTPERQAGCGNA